MEITDRSSLMRALKMKVMAEGMWDGIDKGQSLYVLLTALLLCRVLTEEGGTDARAASLLNVRAVLRRARSCWEVSVSQ